MIGRIIRGLHDRKPHQVSALEHYGSGFGPTYCSDSASELGSSRSTVLRERRGVVGEGTNGSYDIKIQSSSACIEAIAALNWEQLQ